MCSFTGLVMLLQDPDPVVRVKAAEAMGHFHWEIHTHTHTDLHIYKYKLLLVGCKVTTSQNTWFGTVFTKTCRSHHLRNCNIHSNQNRKIFWARGQTVTLLSVAKPYQWTRILYHTHTCTYIEPLAALISFFWHLLTVLNYILYTSDQRLCCSSHIDVVRSVSVTVPEIHSVPLIK